MTSSSSGAGRTTNVADRLAHVRWIAGGTGAGKSTVARLLADLHGLDILDGDRAEHTWVARATPDRQPRLHAQAGQTPGDRWADRAPEEVFRSMAGLHGETAGFLVEDLLGSGDPPAARGTEASVLVDYFGILPRDLAPLLRRPRQAVFLLPTPEFRRRALTARYADPERARANWGRLDPTAVLAKRLARDALWDAEVRGQARALGLRIVTVDGSRPPAELAAELSVRLGLPAR